MDPKPKRKRPYKPPTIRTDKVYERRALACGKNGSIGGFNCSRSPKVS
jgi:hypothetical protein